MKRNPSHRHSGGSGPRSRFKLREGHARRPVDGVFTPDDFLAALDGPVAPPVPQPLDARTIQPVVRRLERVAADYLAGAPRVGVQLDLEDLDFVIARLISESQGLVQLPAFAEDTKGFFLAGLYDELLREPSNIFHQIEVSEESVRLEAMTAEFWRACLQAWRIRLPRQATSRPTSPEP
ncbi:MAG: hypothetical protein FJ405_14070 [Verrucomicrobia bacterium]|nr:hypothetical protein [Verrucomicrobiota bacterium]